MSFLLALILTSESPGRNVFMMRVLLPGSRYSMRNPAVGGVESVEEAGSHLKA